jgi:hypothetical protein
LNDTVNFHIDHGLSFSTSHRKRDYNRTRL